MQISARSSVFKLGLLALAALSCSTVQTKADYDRSANFGAFHTFKMLEGKTLPSESGAPPNTMVADRIREEIKTQLMSQRTPSQRWAMAPSSPSRASRKPACR